MEGVVLSYFTDCYFVFCRNGNCATDWATTCHWL